MPVCRKDFGKRKNGRDNNGDIISKNKVGEVIQKKLVMLQMTVAMVHLSATRIMLNYFQTASQEIRLSGFPYSG